MKLRPDVPLLLDLVHVPNLLLRQVINYLHILLWQRLRRVQQLPLLLPQALVVYPFQARLPGIFMHAWFKQLTLCHPWLSTVLRPLRSASFRYHEPA